MGNSPSKKNKNNTSTPKNKQPTPSSPNLTPVATPPPQTRNNNEHIEKPQPLHAAPHTPAEPSPATHNPSRSDSDNKGFSNKKVDDLFDKYKDKDCPDDDGQPQIGPEGIEQLCKDISVDPEDVLVLVLAWHLNAQRMGFFSKPEFVNGMQKLGVDNISKLKAQLSNFKKDLDDPAKFKEIYRFSFGFAKEKETKIIDLETAGALLALVLGNRFPHTEPLRQFLKEQTTYKSVNLDQWMNILEFSRSIRADLSNYDENSAWPVLLDEYCEWARKRQA
jgi:DCN1-like protein 4/5